MKLTENRVDTLIDTLNDLICDEQSITREQRENLIKTVATRVGLRSDYDSFLRRKKPDRSLKTRR